MANNYCAVPHIYLDECAVLSDAEFGRLMRALLRYSSTGEAIELDGNERFFARRMMVQEDVFNDRYETGRKRRLECAKMAARIRWHGYDDDDDGGGDADACGRMQTDAQDASTVQYR